MIIQNLRHFSDVFLLQLQDYLWTKIVLPTVRDENPIEYSFCIFLTLYWILKYWPSLCGFFCIDPYISSWVGSKLYPRAMSLSDNTSVLFARNKAHCFSFVNYECVDLHKTLPCAPTINDIRPIPLVNSLLLWEHYYDSSVASVNGVKIWRRQCLFFTIRALSTCRYT